MSETPCEIEYISKPQNYSFVGVWYDMAGPGHFWMRWRMRAFLNQARSLDIDVSRPWHGVEVGCGHGVVRRQLEQHTAWTVDGIEVDEEALKRNPPGRGRLFFYDVLERDERFAGRYDFVVLFDVLEHIEHTAAFLQACRYMLKPGGRLFINVPAGPYLFSPYDTVQGHFRRYDRQLLLSQLSEDGWKILDIRYWGWVLVPVLLVRKMLLSGKSDKEEVMRTGFQPPHPMVNSAFTMLMSMETGLMRRPPWGTSLMAVAADGVSG